MRSTFPAFPALLVWKARPVLLALKGLRARPVLLAPPVPLARKVIPGLLAIRAPPVLLARMARPVRLAIRGHKDLPGRLAPRGRRVRKATLALPVLPVLLARMARSGPLDRKAIRATLAPLARKAIPVPLDPLVRKATRATPALLARKARKVIRGLLGPKATRATPALLARKGRKVIPDRKAPPVKTSQSPWLPIRRHSTRQRRGRQNWWCSMPKLDLKKAVRIKSASGEVIALKGPGFSWPSGFQPESLFANGEQGAWLEPVAGQVFTDTAGTIPAAFDDPIGFIASRAGTISGATQDTADKRPLFKNPGAQFDGADDALEVIIPAGWIIGEMYYASSVGKGVFGVEFPEGVKEFGNAAYAKWDKRIDGLVFLDRSFTEAEKSNLDSAFSQSGDFDTLSDGASMFHSNNLTSLPDDMTLPALTNGSQMFRSNRLTSLPAGMALSALTNGYLMFFGNRLTSLPAGMTLPALTNGTFMFRSNTNLAIIPSDFASESNCTNWNRAFESTNLTQQSIDNVLINLAARGTSNGAFGQSGGSAPSAAGEAAIDEMRSRGWTITVTGGY